MARGSGCVDRVFVRPARSRGDARALHVRRDGVRRAARARRRARGRPPAQRHRRRGSERAPHRLRPLAHRRRVVAADAARRDVRVLRAGVSRRGAEQARAAGVLHRRAVRGERAAVSIDHRQAVRRLPPRARRDDAPGRDRGAGAVRLARHSAVAGSRAHRVSGIGEGSGEAVRIDARARGPCGCRCPQRHPTAEGSGRHKEFDRGRNRGAFTPQHTTRISVAARVHQLWFRRRGPRSSAHRHGARRSEAPRFSRGVALACGDVCDCHPKAGTTTKTRRGRWSATCRRITLPPASTPRRR